MNDRSLPKSCLAPVLVLLAALTAGCTTPPTPTAAHQPATMGGPQGVKPAAGVVVAEQLTAAERSFMTQALNRATYEVEVSRLAADRATDPRLRSYALMVANFSSQANNELAAMMRAKGVPRPSGLSADKATKLHRLAALRPSPDFDLGYARVVGVEDHQSTIALYERARRDARDRDLRAWIDKTLPVLRNHLAAAQNLAGRLAG
jgi:putative membrane protein